MAPTTLLHGSDTLAFATTAGRTDDDDAELEADEPDDETTTVDLGGLPTLVTRAIERDVDAVVHTGNLFRSPAPAEETIEGVRVELRRLADADVPCYVVAGDRETAGDGDALDRIRDGETAHGLGAEPARVGDVALFGIDHLESESAFRQALAALDPAPEYTYNVIACHQRIWPPLPQSDALLSAFDAMEATDVFVDDVLAGGTDEPHRWENDDFDYCVTYAGSTNPRHREDGVPTGTLIEAATDEHSHERVPLTASDPEAEIAQLRAALAHEPADLDTADVETLADLYGLAARAKDLFDERRRAIREEILDRVHDDAQIQGQYATVTRQTSKRRVTKSEREVFGALRRAGIDPYEVLSFDSSALRELSEAGHVADEDVFDREERTYVRVSDTDV